MYLASCATLISMSNENLLVLGFAKTTHWQATLISRHHHRLAALKAADQWLAHQDDAMVAIAESEADAGPIDWRAVGWTPLAIEETIWQAVERHRDTVSPDLRATSS